jgi:hypothetical protein
MDVAFMNKHDEVKMGSDTDQHQLVIETQHQLVIETVVSKLIWEILRHILLFY